MALTASTVGPYFASGSISFSQLRSNFKETSSGEVKASELLRVTDTTNTDPIVPDATENSNIATSTNLKASQFRNSIKYYNLNQGASDTQILSFKSSILILFLSKFIFSFFKLIILSSELDSILNFC